MEILNKIIDFLTANPFENEDEAENRELYRDLNKKIKKIKRDNKNNIMKNHIKPFLYEQFYKNNGIFPSDEQLEKMANNAFNQGKALGYIDQLNARVNK